MPCDRGPVKTFESQLNQTTWGLGLISPESQVLPDGFSLRQHRFSTADVVSAASSMTVRYGRWLSC